MQTVGSEKIRVIVVDDHELFRQGVSTIITQYPTVEVIGEAADGKMAVELYQTKRPDVVIMDIHMPIMSGLEATRAMRSLDPEAKILILTVSDTEEYLFEAIKSGAFGYVLKSASPQSVVDSVQRIYAGEPVIPGNLAVKIIRELSSPKMTKVAEIDPLTEREIDVLRQLSTGASNRDIGGALYISENTVRNHVRNILEKLHVNNRGQATAYAMRSGYTLPEDNADSC